MTMCIGALMRQDFGDRIALCFDTKVSCDEFGSETEYKFFPLSKELCCLVAGKMGAARQLVLSYRKYLATVTLDPLTVIDQLEEPIHALRKKAADSYVLRRLAVPYEEFRQSGARWVGEECYQEHMRAILSHRMGAELIIAGFIDEGTVPVLATLKNDEIELQSNTAMIGSGAYVAEPVLHSRKHLASTDWRAGAYNVYEAKRASEIGPAVGSQTRLFLIHPPEGSGAIRISTATSEGMNFMESLFGEYGPKRMVGFPEYPNDCFMTPAALPDHKSTKVDSSRLPPLPELSEGSDVS